jgi:hypothetical protein
MNEAVLKELEAYNEDEIFYKECWERRNSVESLKAYLQQYSQEELEARHLIVPELHNGFLPYKLEDKQIFLPGE